MFDLIKSVSGKITGTTGIEISANRYHLLEHYLKKRITKLQLKTPQEFLIYLDDNNSEEFIQLINTITVNETYFFRHCDQFELLKKLILERVKIKPFEPVKIWSAGCASGAEPYSIAIIAKEISDLFGSEISMLATDIDANELKTAVDGIYTERAVMTEMPTCYLPFFIKNNNAFEINKEIKKLVKFEKHNLFADNYPDNFDFIFCRNALIYFSNENQISIKIKFYNSLKKDGCLFLSPSESLFEFDEFFLPVNSAKGVKAYRKWTTDRRLNENKLLIPKEIFERRRPIECYPMPSIFFDDTNNTIHINGIIAGGGRIDFIINKLSNIFVKKMADGSKTINYNLNLNNLVWISNTAVSALKKIINDLKNYSIRLDKILCDKPNIKEWLEISGIVRLSQNYFIVSQEHEKFDGKELEVNNIDNFNYKNRDEKIIFQNKKADNKTFQKIKCRSLTTEIDISDFNNRLINCLKKNSDSEIEIDFTTINDINPKFAYIWRRFLKAFSDTHNRILLRTGKNEEISKWFKKNNEGVRLKICGAEV